jgi:hypothetical protein
LCHLLQLVGALVLVSELAEMSRGARSKWSSSEYKARLPSRADHSRANLVDDPGVHGVQLSILEVEEDRQNAEDDNDDTQGVDSVHLQQVGLALESAR